MKHLVDIINEANLEKYKLSDDFDTKAEKILNEFVNKLPKFPGITKSKNLPGQNSKEDGTFWFNKFDLQRSPAESAQYIGSASKIILNVDSKNNNYDVETVKNAIESIFKITIKEGVFDDNISKDMPEVQWVVNLYDVMSKYFGTKNFSKVKSEYCTLWGWKSGIYKELQQYPTIEKDGLIISLYDIDLYNFKPDYEYSKIELIVFIYEKKDPAKVAAIKAANDTLRSSDTLGRELKVGDTVVYVDSGGFHNSFKGFIKGTVNKVSRDMVEVDNKRVSGYKCVLIARAGGKMIE